MATVRAHETRTFELHGFTFHPLATPSLGSPDVAAWRVEAPPGAQSPRHSMSRDEVFVVQSGRLVADVAGEPIELSPGDALTVPADAALVLSNPFDEPAVALACTTAGMQATVGDRTFSPVWAQ